MQVQVRDNNVDQALRALKKKLQREGVFREMKLKQHFEKPSEKKAREKAEAIRRTRKLARKKAQRETATRRKQQLLGSRNATSNNLRRKQLCNAITNTFSGGASGNPR